MSFDRRFLVDVMDSSGTIIGDGPLQNVQSVSVTETIDEIGSISFSVPASDSKVIDLVSNENMVQVRTTDGIIAKGFIHNIGFAFGEGGVPMKTVSGPDLLYELVHLTTGYNSVYNNLDVKTAIVGTTATTTSLLGSTGWTQGSVEDYGNETVEYSAETRFSALAILAQQIGRHIRQGATYQTLDFGVFGASSGIRITNMHQLSVATYATTDIAIIGSLTVNTISSDIENRLFPLGKDGFDMRDAEAASANILVMTNHGPNGHSTTCNGAITAADTSFVITAVGAIVIGDELWIGDETDWTQAHEIVKVTNVAGTTVTILDEFANSFANGTTVIRNPQFYVEDAASQGSYGVRESCPQFGWIGPADKSANLGQQQTAANALYAAANARLTRYKDPYKSYTLDSVLRLPYDLKVGQKARIVFKGAASVFGAPGVTLYEDIDDDFYVVKITREWGADGSIVASLDVSNVNRPTPNNASLVLFNLDTMKWIGL